jgi:choline dehydrogenase-like flavoprotein
MFVTDGNLSSDAYDVFVIGSGPAGTSLSLALAKAGKRVLILDSGEEESVRAELANCIGYGHYSGDYWNGHWIRMLGGTSNVWTGWCTTLREIDMDNPAVGVRWPIRRSDLLPYWKRAATFLDHDPDFVDFETPLVEGFVYRPVPMAAPVRIASKYLPALKSSRSITVAPGRSVVGFAANDGRSAIVKIEYFDHRAETKRELVTKPAQSVVLAGGGIGNAQLLLQPGPGGAVPIGNERDLVGRFLMEHPQFNNAGECALDAALDRYWPAANKHSGIHAVVADRTLSLEHNLHACSLQCARKTEDDDMARYLSRKNGRPFYHYDITARAEMLPSPENRVVLTAERDRFGLYRPAARCVLTARDFMNVEMNLRLLGATLIRLGRGRVRVNNDRIYKEVRGQGHTMGTTRMGDSASTSVVNSDCRVHGYENLFVAGSSVFPCAGYANPTITIVALALRLADTLAKTR